MAALFPKMTLDDIEKACENRHLSVFGAFRPGPEDLAPENTGTLVLLGPGEPGFWAAFTAGPEYRDGRSDPMDRWSERVIGELSKDLNAKAYFPFGGPPYPPFTRWARASGRAHESPVGLLVHDAAGLMVSYRGALGFSERMDLPENPPSPCIDCKNKPCLSACPVDAFAGPGYDVAACKADLDRPENDCISKGCAVRRACPAGRGYGRVEAQSAFHMRAFR